MLLRISILFILLIIIGCQGILNVPFNNIQRRSNLTCASDSPMLNYTGCELCIVEFFNNGSTGAGSSDYEYSCALISNSFRRTSQRCTGFSNSTDIGYGICSPLPYETFDIHILCICATDFCNPNITACRQSVNQQLSSIAGPPAPLPSIYRNLSQTINCSINTADQDGPPMFCALETSPFMDANLCQQYFTNTTVLCQYSITVDNPMALMTAWAIDNYEYELDIVIDQMQNSQQDNSTSVYYNDTAGVFFVATTISFSGNDSSTTELCLCTANNCNNNLQSCLSDVSSWSSSNYAHQFSFSRVIPHILCFIISFYLFI